MIYTIINAVLVIFLIWFSYYTADKMKLEERNPLITMEFYLMALTAIASLTTLSAIIAPERLTLFLGRMLLIVQAAYMIDFCVFCLCYPSLQWNKALVTAKWILSIVVILMAFRLFLSIRVSDYLGLSVMALPLFTGNLTNYLNYTWYDFYRSMFLYTLPLLSALIMLLRSEAKENRLEYQRAVLNTAGLLFFWFFLYVLRRASERVPMFSMFFPIGLITMHAILVRSSVQNRLYNALSVLGAILKFFLCFVLPAMIVGFFFPRLWTQFSSTLFKFTLCLIPLMAAALTVSYQISKLLSRRSGFRSAQYAAAFEEELAKLDYSGEPEEIVHNMRDIFVRNVGLTDMRVLVDNGMEVLESVYDVPGADTAILYTGDKVFDSLMNQNRTIILRSVVENTYAYAVDREALVKVFEKSGGDAIILLTEGRRIIGALLLGAKTGGNIYTDYDAGVFQKLYSYFFVFGYYMKNIANQAVVGTVNREIMMSAQIITSIQENMDAIKSQRFDSGYLMRHAHNIGGEFIDFIRLSPDRHIVVMGDLSGKGISASMSMVIVKSIIRSFLQETKDFKLLVDKVNKFIRFNLPKGTFFEGFFGLIDFKDNTLYYINCGVPAMFLYTRSYNNVIEIQGDGKVLGFVKDISPFTKVKKTSFNSGDILLACTDGLVDSRNIRGEKFGKDRIQKSIMENTAQSAQKIADFTFQALNNFTTKGLDDDVSILVLKCIK